MLDPNSYPIVPVGTILIYALSTESTLDQLNLDGWLVCDGGLYSFQDYSELYGVIGQIYGGEDGSFAVPDLQGLFVRGVADANNKDPDASLRTQPRPELKFRGNSGNAVGTLQMDDLGSHSHQYHSYDNVLKTTHTDGHACLAVGNVTQQTGSTGGSETRPLNQSVYFLIKANSLSNAIPVGGVLAYGAQFPQTNPQGWQPCVGTSVNLDDLPDNFGTLFAQAYGGADANSCYLPDYRGRFLRGVDTKGEYDPDWKIRTAPNPGSYAEGNKEGHVGSIQNTCLIAHQHNYQYHNTVWHCAATAIGYHAQGTSPEETYLTDGQVYAEENRPVNLNVNFLVKTQQDLSTTHLALPLASIVAYAGPIGATAEESLINLGFLPCDGRAIATDLPQYKALYAVLGNNFGGDDQGNFYMPDLRGLFLRGTDLGAGRDPDANTRTAPRPHLTNQGNSGDAVGSFQTDALQTHSHTFNMADPDSWHHINKGGADTGVYEYNCVQLPQTDSYGGTETRPRNLSVNFLISFRI